ncbi:MerC domain-containing protein [Corallococcus exiguus]
MPESDNNAVTTEGGLPGASCDCLHHRAEASRPGGRWASWVPLLACAVCPGHLSAYAQVLSFVGIGASLSESTHQLVLGVAIALSLAVNAWRAWRLRSLTPLAISGTGGGLLVLSHALDENALLLWSGAAVLLGGILWERQVWPRLPLRRASTTLAS